MSSSHCELLSLAGQSPVNKNLGCSARQTNEYNLYSIRVR